MLNEEGDGVVFSSLYSRERMSIFAKPIKNNKSEYELSDVESAIVTEMDSLTSEEQETLGMLSKKLGLPEGK